jgi:hypothetical protein
VIFTGSDGDLSLYEMSDLAITCNQCNLQVSSGYPKHKNPNSKRNGAYNLTMAISTGLPSALM